MASEKNYSERYRDWLMTFRHGQVAENEDLLGSTGLQSLGSTDVNLRRLMLASPLCYIPRARSVILGRDNRGRLVTAGRPCLASPVLFGPARVTVIHERKRMERIQRSTR